MSLTIKIKSRNEIEVFSQTEFVRLYIDEHGKLQAFWSCEENDNEESNGHDLDLDDNGGFIADYDVGG